MMQRKNDLPRADLDVTPLLRSIAGELVSRSLAILELEARMEAMRAQPGDRRRELDLLAAELANQRRELRRAEGELKRLGWKRDEKRPLRFLCSESPQGSEDAWQLQGTGFYRSLDFEPAE